MLRCSLMPAVVHNGKKRESVDAASQCLSKTLSTKLFSNERTETLGSHQEYTQDKTLKSLHNFKYC